MAAHTEEDDYIDSFASLDENDHHLAIPDSNHHYKLTPIGEFVKSNTPPITTVIMNDDNYQLPSTSSQPKNNNHETTITDSSFYYEKSEKSSKTPKFHSLNHHEEDELMGEMIELDDVDLGSPPIKHDGLFQSQLRMLDDHHQPTSSSAATTPTIEGTTLVASHHGGDDKHKSVWSDLAIQFLKGEHADDFLTFEDAEASPEVLKLLEENRKIVDNRKLLWRALSGGFLFSFLYALGGCFIFVLFGFCFSLPCSLQLWRIAKFLLYPYTKSETYFYLLCLINTDPKLMNKSSTVLDRRMSVASSMTSSTQLERKYSVTSVKEARQLLFNDKEKKGVLLWIANIIWLCLFGWWIALLHLIFGGSMLACNAIFGAGEDFGKRHLSLVKLALLPFGLSIKK